MTTDPNLTWKEETVGTCPNVADPPGPGEIDNGINKGLFQASDDPDAIGCQSAVSATYTDTYAGGTDAIASPVFKITIMPSM